MSFCVFIVDIGKYLKYLLLLISDHSCLIQLPLDMSADPPISMTKKVKVYNYILVIIC